LVYSFDQSQLEYDKQEKENIKNIIFHSGDAFSIAPKIYKEIREKPNWILSDCICSPTKLFEWINSNGWIENLSLNLICTLKLRNHSEISEIEQQDSIIRKFEKVPNSILLHLNSNQHELTWIRIGKR
jgi:hypothetical protein